MRDSFSGSIVIEAYARLRVVVLQALCENLSKLAVMTGHEPSIPKINAAASRHNLVQFHAGLRLKMAGSLLR
jgi:hypothetical protein